MARTRGKVKPPAAAPPAPSRPLLVPALTVAAAAIIPWLPGIFSPFLFDDLNTIAHNPAIRSFDLVGFFSDPTLASVKPGNWPWRPLLLGLDALRFALFELRPAGWHLTQLLVHALNSVLVFLFALRVFKLERTAMAAGLLFALAPVQAQSALYLSARSMVVALPFALGALGLAVNDGRGRWRPAAVAGLVFAAMLASEGALVAVGWIGLAFWARGEPLTDRRRLGILSAALGGGLLYYLMRKLLPAPTGWELLQYWQDSFNWKNHVLAQVQSPFVLGRYFLLPTGSAFFHHAGPAELSGLRAAAALAALAAAAGVMVFAHRRSSAGRVGAAGMAWYLGSLLPAVFAPLNIAWSEHRAYLAVPGLCIAAAWLLDRLSAAAGERLRRATVALAAAVMVLLALAAAGRARDFSDPARVLAETVRRSPSYFAGWNLLGFEAYSRGDCRRAEAYLKRATALSPGFADGFNTLAACYARDRDFPSALEAARRASELDPTNPTYLNTLAVALMELGRDREAQAYLERALALARPDDPNRPVMERNLGRLQARRSGSP